MSGRRFIPAWTAMARRRAAADAGFPALGPAPFDWFRDPEGVENLSRGQWKRNPARMGWSVHHGQVGQEPASSR